MLLPTVPLLFLLLLLQTRYLQAKGPSRDNKLFIECAVRAPKGVQEPETVVSQTSMAKSGSMATRIFLFGLGGNLYVGHSDLKELCKEDKEFAGSSKSAPGIKEGVVDKCDQGALTLKGGKEVKFTHKKHDDFEQCYAGQYELFECSKQACGGREKLVLVEKDAQPTGAKPYAFVYGGKMLVKEVTLADVSAAQMECVKKACPGDSVPMVNEVLRWKKVPKNEKKADEKGKFKVYKECAVKRKRVGTDGNNTSGGTRMETLLAHVKMDKQVLFFGMGGNLYAGDSSLANECGEDKYFTKSKVNSIHATLLGCHKAYDVKGKKGNAKLSLKTANSAGPSQKFYSKSEQLQLDVKTNSHGRGSQCHAQNGNKAQYDIYQCPKEQCGGQERVVLIRKKENAKNKLVAGGELLVQEVFFADTTPKQWQCVQQICGQGTRIPMVESVKRKLDKSEKGPQHQAVAAGQAQEAKNPKKKSKRRGRKPTVDEKKHKMGEEAGAAGRKAEGGGIAGGSGTKPTNSAASHSAAGGAKKESPIATSEKKNN